MPAGTGRQCSRKYSFGDYTVAHVSYFRRTVCEQGWPKEQFVLSNLSKTAPGSRKISNEEKRMELWQVAANCTDNVFYSCQFKREVFGLQVKIVYYYDKYFYWKTPLSSPFSYQSFRLCLPLFFPEGYNLLLHSYCWNSVLLYSVCVFLPLLALALALMFAGTIGLNLVLFTNCDYTGNSHCLQVIFFKYDETFVPGGDSWENTSIVWKEVICFLKKKIIISLP